MLTKIRSKLKSRTQNKSQDGQITTPSIQNETGVIRNADTDRVFNKGVDDDIPQRQNLWEVAGERLSEKHRVALDLENACSIIDSIEDVIKTTKDEYRVYKAGGLEIRKRDGGQINVRDSAKSIICYTLQVQDVVKTLVSFDPNGYASTAWSAVSIGLTLIVNSTEYRDEIIEASEYLAQTLSYYTIVDIDYRERGVRSDLGLEVALVEVYTAVLEYAANVEIAKRGNIAPVQQLLEDLKKIVEKRGQVALNWGTERKPRVDHSRPQDTGRQHDERNWPRVREAGDYYITPITLISKGLQDLEILDWLSMASYSDIQFDTQARRTPNTGNWLLSSPTYTEWKVSPGKILWCYGAAGCGKSVLCSTIIRDIEWLCELDSSENLAYWYFRFYNDETQKVTNMVRSILRQLMPRTIPAPLVKLWKHHSDCDPKQQKFADILDIVLETSQGEFFIIIDAMDECPMAEHDGRNSLFGFIEELSAKYPSKLHILVTSRLEPDIRLRLQQYHSLDVETGIWDDVEAFVRDQISHGRLNEWDEPIKRLALEKLLDTPRLLRFRAAELAIKRLQQCKSEHEFHRDLDTISGIVENTYIDILERLPTHDRDAVRTILIWLSLSAVPLDLKTIAAVVSFQFPEDVVRICTTFLVNVNLSDNTVRLAHFSVKEFLVREIAQCNWYQFSEASGHSVIVHKAIDSLLETANATTKITAEQRSLLIYSAEYWDWHLMKVEDEYFGSSSLQRKVDRLFSEREVYFNWVLRGIGVTTWWK